jgi:hypothetical protein
VTVTKKDYFDNDKEMRVVYEWTDGGGKDHMNITEKRNGRVGVFVPIFGGDFDQTSASVRVASSMTPSGADAAYELVGASKDNAGVWNQTFNEPTQVLLGSDISDKTGTVVFSRPLQAPEFMKSMEMVVDGQYNLALSWAVMYPS